MSNLENTLKQLRLSGLLQTLDVRLQEAVANRLGHAEFLELICQDEINVRQQRLMERRTKAADFRGLKTLEDFDWSFNPAMFAFDSNNVLCVERISPRCISDRSRFTFAPPLRKWPRAGGQGGDGLTRK